MRLVSLGKFGKDSSSRKWMLLLLKSLDKSFIPISWKWCDTYSSFRRTRALILPLFIFLILLLSTYNSLVRSGRSFGISRIIWLLHLTMSPWKYNLLIGRKLICKVTLHVHFSGQGSCSEHIADELFCSESEGLGSIRKVLHCYQCIHPILDN